MPRILMISAAALTVGLTAAQMAAAAPPDLSATIPPDALSALSDAANAGDAAYQAQGKTPTVDPKLTVSIASTIANAALKAVNDATGAAAGGGAADPLGATPVSSSDLSNSSGGSNVFQIGALNDQALQETNTGNTMNAAAITNGAVTFQSNAFSGFTGIGNFVIDTGNQNNVQGVMNVTIIGAPATH